VKVLGLSAGRKLGNSEILLREALMATEELGAEIEIIRLLDLDIKHCTRCEECTMTRLKTGVAADFIIRDDHFPFLLDKMGECNGIIVSFPTYCFRPPGYTMMIRDRFHGIGDKYNKQAAEKPKVGATISVGGFIGVSYMRTMTSYFLPPNTKLVDQMTLLNTSRPAQVLLNDEAVARARSLGQNLGQALKIPFDKVEYVGKEYGACPKCHMDMLWVKGKNVVCPTCGMKARVETKGDITMFIFDNDNELKKPLDRATFSKERDDAIRRYQDIMEKNRQIIKEKMQKYAAYEKNRA
jgi:multimeric flavodoxin WrbA